MSGRWSSLLVDQIEFADVIILNKTDIATPAEREAARAIVRSLNAGARIIEASHAKVDPRSILDTGLFDFDTAHRHPTWFKELNGFKDHQPETEEYGISSFVYRARGPFEPLEIACVLLKVMARRDPREGLLLARHAAAVGG